MASPGSYGGSYGSSLGTVGFGNQHARTQTSVETLVDRNWQFDQGQHKSKCRKDAAEFLEQSLRALAKSREPGDHDGAARHATIQRLQSLLRDPQLFPPPSQLQLVPYGSFLSSCYSRSSDLDLALTGQVAAAVVGHLEYGFRPGPAVPLDRLSREECVELLRRLAGALESRQLTRGSVDRRPLDARVPIIKFEEASSGIECDVCVTTRGCDFKASIMRLLHGLQPSLAPLIQLVKVWAKHHDINSAHCSTLNSWSLALMVLFSLQTFPGGHLLPPLWRVFHDEEPAGPAGTGRPLQDTSLPLDVMLVVAEARCAEEGNRLVSAVWSRSEPPDLVQQLLWFLSCFTTITCQWRDNVGHRNWRVSTWLGRGYSARFAKAYVAAVEEPFDCNDNTARSLGVKERNEHTLPYVAWVFGHSVHLLRNVSTVGEAARVLAWLFGAEALPCVGLQRLKVPSAGIHKSSLQQLERMAADMASKHTRAPRGESHDGAGAAAAKDCEGPQGEASADEFEKRAAIRALIDATKVGSPIMCLEEWRLCMGNRSRPPYAWHPLAPLQRPPPPRLNPHMQPPLLHIERHQLDGQHELLKAAGASNPLPQVPPEVQQLADGLLKSFMSEQRSDLWLAEHVQSLLARHGAGSHCQEPGQQQREQQHAPQQIQQLQQQQGEPRLPPGLSPVGAANGFAAGGFGAVNGAVQPLAEAMAAYGAGGVGGGFGGLRGFEGATGAASGGSLTAAQELLQPPQQQQQQPPKPQPLQDAPGGGLGPAPGGGRGAPEAPEATGLMDAGEAMLQSLQPHAIGNQAIAAAERARAAAAATLAKMGLGPSAQGANDAAGGGVYGAAATAAPPPPQSGGGFGTPLFGFEQQSRPVSAFRLFSGSQPLPSHPNQYPLPQHQHQQHSGMYASPASSSLPFSLSMLLSGNAQLQPESSLPMPPAPPPQQQHLQPQPELADLLRLLSVSPGMEAATWQQPPPGLSSSQPPKPPQPRQPSPGGATAVAGYPLSWMQPQTAVSGFQPAGPQAQDSRTASFKPLPLPLAALFGVGGSAASSLQSTIQSTQQVASAVVAGAALSHQQQQYQQQQSAVPTSPYQAQQYQASHAGLPASLHNQPPQPPPLQPQPPQQHQLPPPPQQQQQQSQQGPSFEGAYGCGPPLFAALGAARACNGSGEASVTAASSMNTTFVPTMPQLQPRQAPPVPPGFQARPPVLTQVQPQTGSQLDSGPPAAPRYSALGPQLVSLARQEPARGPANDAKP